MPSTGSGASGPDVGALPHTEALAFDTHARPRRRTGTSVAAPWSFVAVLGSGAVALILGWHLLAQPHALYGVQQYDDGAYLAGALQLLAGRLPYHDFAFVQPPGVTLLLAPVALLGHFAGLRVAVAASRVLTVGAVVADVVLCARLLRHRGLLAPLVAGMVLALYPAAFSVERAFLIEPWLVLACLLGFSALLDGDWLASPRRLFLAGIAFGVAGTLKTMAVVALSVALLAALPLARRGLARLARESVLRILAGAALGFAVPCLPFFLASPRAFVHDVVTTQLTRSAATTTPVPARLAFALGTRQNGIGRTALTPVALARTNHEAEIVALVLACVLVAFLLVPALARRGSRLEWAALLGTVATGSSLLVPQIFYAHYAWFFAPFLALGVALALERCARLAGLALVRVRVPGLGRLALGTAVVVALCAGGVRLGVGDASYAAATVAKAGDPGPKIAALVPAGACAIADAAILLITANRYSTGAGCPAVVDPTGAWLVADPHHPERASGPRSPALVATWRVWFAEATYVVLSRPTTFRIPWTPALRAYFGAHDRLVKASGAFVYRRVSASR